MQNREPNFLALTRKVFSDPTHPYAQLFKVAGCDYADLELSVGRRGLESTLQALLAEGVYITLDEFKGRKAIVRGGRHIPSTLASWDNDAGKGEFEVSSSGTSGRAIRTSSSLAAMAHSDCGAQVFMRELGLSEGESVSVARILPGYGLFACLAAERLNYSYQRWYAIGAPPTPTSTTVS